MVAASLHKFPGLPGLFRDPALLTACRCRIHQWHLANTRVTAHTAQLLSCLTDLIFLDMRGSGVTASQLTPLRRKFSLNAPQGAVLSRSAAMTLAAVALDRFVCCQPVEHNSMAATSPGGGSNRSASRAGHSSGPALQSWVQLGVRDLITARTELEKQERQAAAMEANTDAAVAAQQPLVTCMQTMEQPMYYTLTGSSQAACAFSGLPLWYHGPPHAGHGRQVALSYPLPYDQCSGPAGWPPAM